MSALILTFKKQKVLSARAGSKVKAQMMNRLSTLRSPLSYGVNWGFVRRRQRRLFSVSRRSELTWRDCLSFIVENFCHLGEITVRPPPPLLILNCGKLPKTQKCDTNRPSSISFLNFLESRLMSHDAAPHQILMLCFIQPYLSFLFQPSSVCFSP